MDSQQAKTRTAEFIGHYAELVRQKEEALECPAKDGPSYRDMIYLYKAFAWFDTANDSQPPSEIHALMELIAEVRDSWSDPERDVIGRELFPILSEIHYELGKVMDEAVPEATELRQQQENLRAAVRAIRRNRMTPSFGILRRFVAGAKTLLGKKD